MHIQYPSDSTFWDQIQKLILEGHTKAALKLLLDKDYPIAKVLDNQLDKIQEQYELELIWFDEWDITQNQIIDAILNLGEMNKKVEIPVALKLGVQQLVNEKKTEEALLLLMQAGHKNMTLFLANWNRANAEYAKGKARIEECTRTQARINYAILTMCKVETNNEILESVAQYPDKNAPKVSIWKRALRFFK